ncbi:ADP compounds hydrolase NudE [compost metagenome]
MLAEDLEPSTALGDEPEPLEVIRVPLALVPALVASGELHEARAISALFMALSRKSAP